MPIIPTVARSEISRFRRSPATKAVLVAVAIIPFIYAGALVWSNTDPAGRLDGVPAAVVVDDVPVETTDANGEEETIALGRAIAADLVDSDEATNFDWTLTSGEDAANGLRDGTYYAVLNLPEKFSEAAVSTGEEDTAAARAATMTVTTNDGSNFIAGNLARTITTQVAATASKTVSQTYLDRIYLGFNTIADEMDTAARGADRVSGGAKDLKAGTGDLADGASQLGAGAEGLSTGLTELDDAADALSSGANKTAQGADAVADASDALAAGAGRLAEGTNQLDTAVESLPSDAEKLATGASEVDTAARQLATGGQTLDSSSSQVAAGANDMKAGVDEYSQAVDTLATNCAALGGSAPLCARLAALSSQSPALRTGASAVATGSSGVAAGASTLSDGLDELAAGTPALAEGTETLSTQATTLVASIADINDGAQDLATGASRLSTASTRLAEGNADLSDGAQRISTGTTQASAGASELSSGSARLGGGAHDVHAGASQLADGAAELSSGLNDGKDQVPTYTQQDREKLSDVASAPITATSERLNPVPSHGSGLAPYFMTLALWVGAMAVYMILRALPDRAVASATPAWRVALVGYLPGSLLAVAQSILMVAIVVWGVGVDPARPLTLLALAALASLTFLAINQALVAALGTKGRFLGLILIVLQLASAGATYPIETTPAFFQALHPWLPMTHAVEAFRSSVAGGDLGVSAAVVSLGLWLAGALSISVLAARRRRIWTASRLHPEVAI